MAKIDAVVASLRTDTGLVRDHNEDFVGAWEPSTVAEQNDYGWLYIVADGVGGAEAGDIASQLATEQTITHFIESDEPNVTERLRQAIRAANEDLRQVAVARGRGGYMATTLCVALIRQDHALFANVGDSRGYLLKEGQIAQITKDHSLVAQLVEEGAITAEEAETHPRRNVILSSLGPMRDPRIDLFDIDVNSGDTLLLCSDGLTRHVGDEEILRIVTSEPPETAAQHLVDLAKQRGGSDNISVAILELQTDLPQTRRPRVVSTHGNEVEMHPGPSNSWGLWVYTIILAAVEAILILLVYYWINV